MKKIIFLIYMMSNGGLERHTVNLSNELVEKGYSVDIVAVRGVSKTQFFDIKDNVRLISVSEKRKRIDIIDASSLSKSVAEESGDKISLQNSGQQGKQSLKRKLTSSVLDFWHNSALLHRFSGRYKKIYRNYFIAENPDIIVAWGIDRYERAYKAAKGLNCKLINAEIVAHEDAIPESSNLYSYHCGMLKKASAIIVQTHSEKEYFKKINDNVLVINNPLKPGLPLPYKGERSKTVVNFCRMAPQKNISLLLDAFKLLHNDFPDYRLKIYGNTVEPAEIEYKKKMIKKIYSTGLEDCVSILPPAADIHEKVLKSAMFASSSDFEGLSNSMLESMAIGLPCVCTDCLGGGTREVMTDHENGLIVPTNDAESMYRAMKEFAENPGLAEKCSENAVKIREKLSAERIARQWLEVIESLERE